MDIAKYKLTPEQLNSIDKSEWLTDRQREIYTLFYRRGWRIEDIAVETGMSRRTIDRKLSDMRKMINGV